MELKDFTIRQINKGLKNKQFSAEELTQSFLERIKREDKEIGAFLEVSEDLALSQAKKIDELISRGEKIPLLAGVPSSIKDNILVKGLKCTAGSKILSKYRAVYDATCITKLKQEGVVILGKANLDEFGMGSSTEHSAFKPTKNPHDTTRVPGGSSGGPAAAVASDECIFALASDTGGSIRQPASFCGVVGLKPTYGAVSRYGLIPYASSLDQIGPLAKNVEDCEIVYNNIKGGDRKDSTSVRLNSKQIPNSKPSSRGPQVEGFQIKKIKIGVPKEYFGKGIEKGVREIIEGAIKKLEKEGAKIEEISLPHSKYALPTYYIIATSEASANLARYDGIKYGLSLKNEASNLLDVYLKTREEGFGEEVKRRIMLGTFALSSGYYDAYYLRAQKVRTLIKKDFDDAFAKIDFILTPVSPFPAFKIGEKIDDPLKMYLSDVYTGPINLAGVPALSMPVGKLDSLPVGLQIIAKPFNEPGIFELAKTIEKTHGSGPVC